jgi:hypothetical protein
MPYNVDSQVLGHSTGSQINLENTHLRQTQTPGAIVTTNVLDSRPKIRTILGKRSTTL